MMTRKHYIILASLIKEIRQNSNKPGAIDEFIRKLSLMLKEDNPRFDAERFVNATR